MCTYLHIHTVEDCGVASFVCPSIGLREFAQLEGGGSPQGSRVYSLVTSLGRPLVHGVNLDRISHVVGPVFR